MKCSNCASDNPEQARFCWNCGYNLSIDRPPAHPHSPTDTASGLSNLRPSSRSASERRVVTALFADVVDSTALAEQLDPEDWAEIMNHAFERMAPVISQYGGVITRLMGDALLAFFGAPLAHEDDPLRAAHASLDLLQAVRDYAEEVHRLYQINFSIRVGLNTGPVVVGEVGSTQVHEYTAMGDAVNLAARMQSAARPMSTWLTENTYRYIAHAFDCTDLGRITIKGKTEPVQVYELIKPKALADRLRGTSSLQSPLVGRHAELAALLAAARRLAGSAAGSGAGQGVLLVGDAGIGKSRLITEWQSAAGQDASLSRLKWATGRCLSYTQSQPYQLLISLLDALLELPESAEQPRRITTINTMLQELLGSSNSDAVLYLGHLMSGNLSDQQSAQLTSLPTPQELQMLYLSALRQLLQSMAQRQPLVIILEDLQWADPSSIDLLARLVPLAGDLPILFCCSSRPDTTAPGWKLYEAIASQFSTDPDRTHLTQISLANLGEGDTARLAENLMRVETLSTKMKILLEKSGGNPLFIEELIRWAEAVSSSEHLVMKGSEGRQIAQDNLASSGLPDTLQGLLLARIDRLPPAARHTLRVAAVIGRRFVANLLHRVLQASRSLAETPDNLASILAQLESTGFIEPLPSAAEPIYQFHHALMQQAAYLTLLKADQRQIHQATGQALIDLFPDQIDANSAVLAYHFGQAGDRGRAIHYYGRAAHFAMRQYALPEAINHYSSALELIEQDSSAATQTASRLYLQRGSAYEKLGNFESARRDLEEALQAGGAIHDMPTQLEALLALGLLWAARDYSQTGDYYQRALQLARQAGMPQELAASLNRVGNWYANLDQPDQGIPLHQEALAIYQQMNDPHGIADTLDLLGMTSALGGDLFRAVEYFSQAIERYRQLDDRHGLASSLTSLGMRGSYFEGSSMITPIERLIDARADVEEGLEIARSIHWQSGQAYALLILAQIASGSGDYRQGIEYGQKALQIAVELKHLQWMSGVNTVLGMIYADLFCTPLALAHLEQAYAQGKESGSINWMRMAAGSLASVWIASGAYDQAADLLDSVLEAGTPAQTVSQRISWCAKAELALVRKDWQAALSIVTRLLSDARYLENDRAGGLVTLLHGRSLLLSGNLVGAEREFLILRSQLETLGVPSLLWRTNACLAKVYAARGDGGGASQSAVDAATIINQIADNLTDLRLRSNFQQGAQTWLLAGCI